MLDGTARSAWSTRSHVPLMFRVHLNCWRTRLYHYGCFACTSRVMWVGITCSGSMPQYKMEMWQMYWIKCMHWLSTLDHKLVFPSLLYYTSFLVLIKMYFSCVKWRKSLRLNFNLEICSCYKAHSSFPSSGALGLLLFLFLIWLLFSLPFLT